MAEKTCAIPSCAALRIGDSSFCGSHGPRSQTGGAAPRGNAAKSIVCPHCQQAGRVTTKRVKVKSGVSGGKATGAVLTGGLSLFATGLSRKQQVTEMRCGNCGVTWHVA
jgi:hypothetical protein